VLGVVLVALGGVLLLALLALQGTRRARQLSDAWSALERRCAGGPWGHGRDALCGGPSGRRGSARGADMLPARGVVWQAVDEHTARAVVDVDGEAVSMLLTVDATGRMQRVVIERWNGDPANGPIGYLPFVVEFEGDAAFDGYRLPRRLRAGWERDGAFRPFFFAELEDATFR
jgi:hypothetical protein